MKSHQKSVPMGVGIAVVIGVVLGVLGYYFFIRPQVASVIYVASSATSTVTGSTTGGGSGVTSSSTVATSTGAAAIDTSSWQTFTSYELGFTVQYPPDLTVDTSDPSAFKVSFPRATYFSTVYGDDVSVSINVNATCTPIVQGARVTQSENVTIGGVDFTKAESSDIGAGNIYDTVMYDTLNNNVCYQMMVLDHHANGAGLYESDPTKMAVLESTRAEEIGHVNDIVMAIISSFSFVTTPTGENEADYSAASAGAAGTSTPTTQIFLDSISSSTVSTGSTIKLIGQGFSGHDTLVQISNGSVTGVLWGGMPTSDVSISATIPDKVCTTYTGASGLPCSSYLILSPGTYAVDVTNQNGTTESEYIRIQ